MPFEVLSSREMVERDLPLVWEWFDHRRGVLAGCEPNAGHIAIAEAQRTGRFETFTLVTQNIDGLHGTAGSTGVIELHGSIRQARCVRCGNLRDLDTLPVDQRPPVCPECSGQMRPNVVLFGENLPADAILKAQSAGAQCDVCVVVGTSGVVYPANELPLIAKRSGARLIEINPEETVLTPRCDISLREPSAGVLPLLFRALSDGN